MEPRVLADIPEYVSFENRERFRIEVAQGIYALMRKQRVNRSALAALLGTSKPYISRILGGDYNNFKIDSLADIFLVLGRAVHLSLGTDSEEFRNPIDEASDTTNESEGLHYGKEATLAYDDSAGGLIRAPQTRRFKWYFEKRRETVHLRGTRGASDDVVRQLSDRSPGRWEHCVSLLPGT